MWRGGKGSAFPHWWRSCCLNELTDFCVVPGAGTAEMKQALELGFSDLEDAMQTAAALLFGAQIIVTRNLPDYRRSPIKAACPDDPLLAFAGS